MVAACLNIGLLNRAPSNHRPNEVALQTQTILTWKNTTPST